MKMDIKVIKNTKNLLLKRSEIVAELVDDKKPSRTMVREKIAAMLNAKPETTVVQKIDSRFGNKKMTITAHVYDDLNQMKKTEGQPSLARNFDEFKKKKGPAKGPRP
jgi:ribosomal protein S24E